MTSLTSYNGGCKSDVEHLFYPSNNTGHFAFSVVYADGSKIPVEIHAEGKLRGNPTSQVPIFRTHQKGPTMVLAVRHVEAKEDQCGSQARRNPVSKVIWWRFMNPLTKGMAEK